MMKLKLSTFSFIVGDLSKQVCMVKTVIFSTGNKKPLISSPFKIMIHVCVKFCCSVQWNFYAICKLVDGFNFNNNVK